MSQQTVTHNDRFAFGHGHSDGSSFGAGGGGVIGGGASVGGGNSGGYAGAMGGGGAVGGTMGGSHHDSRAWNAGGAEWRDAGSGAAGYPASVPTLPAASQASVQHPPSGHSVTQFPPLQEPAKLMEL